MKISTAFPSRWIKAGDLDGDRILTIAKCTIEEVGETREEKPVLWFCEVDQGLILNKTNANTVADLFGDETNEWVGKKVCLYSTRVEFGGRRVDSIRVKEPAEPAEPAEVAEVPF